MKKLFGFLIILAVMLIATTSFAEWSRLIWEPNTEGGPVDGYKIYTSTTSGGPYQQIGTTDASDLDFSIDEIKQAIGTIDNAKRYYWVIKAFNELGDSVDYSNEVSSPLALPEAPMGLLKVE